MSGCAGFRRRSEQPRSGGRALFSQRQSANNRAGTDAQGVSHICHPSIVAGANYSQSAAHVVGESRQRECSVIRLLASSAKRRAVDVTGEGAHQAARCVAVTARCQTGMVLGVRSAGFAAKLAVLTTAHEQFCLSRQFAAGGTRERKPGMEPMAFRRNAGL